MYVLAVITLTPGTVISRRTCGFAGDRAVQFADFAVEEVDVAQAPRDRLGLVVGQFELGEPRPAAHAEHVSDRRAALQPPDQHRVDLVLSSRARAHELAAARQPSARRARPLVGHPDGVELSGGQQLGQRPGVKPVGLGAGSGDAGVVGG